MTTESEAAHLLTAFATCDVASVREICARDVVIYGTDEGERWDSLNVFCAALDDMRELGLTARWETKPVDHSGWIAGLAIYAIPGQGDVPVRVTLIFEARKLVHGHFSLEQRPEPISASLTSTPSDPSIR